MSRLREEMERRVLLLDGAMGTEIQKRRLSEKDFRGELFKNHQMPLKGNMDVLVLTQPDVIASIHESYLEAGADIIETCTFSSQRISQHDYGLEDRIAELNREGARIARKAADRWTALHPSKPRFVAGSVGPTTKLLSISDNPEHPERRSITFDELESAYYEQMVPLIEEGVDALLIETVVDPINAKAAISAAEKAMETVRRRVEIMISATITDTTGHLLSGQTIEAFAIAMAHANPLTLGLNCSLGAEAMESALRRLGRTATCRVSIHPNAGHPNQMGEYDDTPEKMAATMKRFMKGGLVNVVGGCCGTTPAHIEAFQAILDSEAITPRVIPDSVDKLQLSGLKPIESEANFINVGERCNVAGSRKFLRLINEKKYDEAIEIARKQVADGAMAIDINMDDGLLEASDEMEIFLNLLGSEPDIAAVPVMIDSSRFEVIERGLKALQGKGIVNSISLKDGEDTFLQRARTVKRLGAAAIVMAFDEEGQATTFQRKIEICSRAYSLLTEKAGIRPEDIIFDPNILTVATGMEEHLDYALDYIKATEYIRRNLPGVNVSGGLSNLSFAFRGNNPVRESMHAVFLYHAVKAGMNMAILNPATAMSYDEVNPELKEALEEVLFYRRTPEATEKLIELAQSLKATSNATDALANPSEKASIPLAERLRQALIKGNPSSLECDLEAALKEYPSPMAIISGPLMEGMNEVGQQFGEGKMFLPQVVKTARTMKQAVDYLRPHIEAAFLTGNSEKRVYAGKVLIATVKGDVHDIGKNIVGVVMSCNNFQIIDLGVMVSPEAIAEAALADTPDIICLSGLITPSLESMADTLEELERSGVKVPVMVGGAATSPLHTAVKLAPLYSGLVLYMPDASQNPLAAVRLLSPERHQFEKEIRTHQEKLRFSIRKNNAISAPPQRHIEDWTNYIPSSAPWTGTRCINLSVRELRSLIDWEYFYHAWKVKETTEQGKLLRFDAEKLLDRIETIPGTGCCGLAGFFTALSEEDTILIGEEKIVTTRQPGREGKEALSLCDFVSPDKDTVGAFAVTITAPLLNELESLKSKSDDYESLLMQTLCDRLAETASENLHRLTGWGGIRPAIGYPSLREQKNIFAIDRLLDFSRIGLRLTETGAMYPQSSVAGIYISHPNARYFDVPREL